MSPTTSVGSDRSKGGANTLPPWPGFAPQVRSIALHVLKGRWISKGCREYGGVLSLWETVHTVFLYEKGHGVTRPCLMNSPCPSNDAHTFPENECQMPFWYLCTNVHAVSWRSGRPPPQGTRIRHRRRISDLSVTPHSRQQWIPHRLGRGDRQGFEPKSGESTSDLPC